MANRETEILRLNMKRKVNIATVKKNETNPRYIKDSKFKKLVKSIKEFPEMLEKRPIVVDENMVVLGGNMRLEAAKAAGLFEVWIDQASDWNEEQKREFIVKDNVGFGEWDWEILSNDWNEELLVEWGLDIPDFDTDIDDIQEPIDKPKFELKLSFENADDLQKAETEIQELLDRNYKGATISVVGGF